MGEAVSSIYILPPFDLQNMAIKFKLLNVTIGKRVIDLRPINFAKEQNFFMG